MNLWGGPEPLFTTALQRQITHALEHCESVQSVCRLLDVRTDDLKRYAKALTTINTRRAWVYRSRIFQRPPKALPLAPLPQ
jgi:hypothetical protein